MKIRNKKLWDWVAWNQSLKKISGWWIIYATNDFDWLKQILCVCVCVCKMVVEITKETWEKCGIKTIKHYKWKREYNGIVAKNEPYWNTTWAFKYCWCCVKENQKILWQKKQHQIRRKRKIQSIFWRWSKYFYCWKFYTWYNWML